MGSERIDTAALRARADLARNHPEVRRPKAVEVMALCDEADRLNARLAEVEQALRSALNVIDTTHALAYGRDALVAPHDGRSLADHTDDGGVYCWACEFTLEARAVLDKGSSREQ